MDDRVVDFRAGNVVWADRTKILDLVANEITDARVLFRERPSELEDYIADWSNLYRTTEEKEDGRTKSIWKKKENKESDYSLATAYWRIALSQTLGGESMMVGPTQSESDAPVSYFTHEDGRIQTDLSQIVEETFEAMEE